MIEYCYINPLSMSRRGGHDWHILVIGDVRAGLFRSIGPRTAMTSGDFGDDDDIAWWF